ncbi:hypothetical protein ACOSP7_021967 [Xanthoceras sorbifolium]
MAASRLSSYGNNNTDSSVINQVQSSSFPSHLNFNLPLKLDQENYVLWKSQVLPAIRAYDLEYFILGESTSPPKFVETINEESGEVTQTLRSTLSPTVIGQVTRCVTSYEIWTVIERMYSQHSLAKIMQIRSQIQGTKKGSMTITKYVLKLRTLADSLAASGYPMSERDLLLSVLQGLGNEYDACILTFTALQSTITVLDAQFLMMSYEARLDYVSANFVQSGNGRGQQSYNRGRRGRGRGNGRGTLCQLCGKVGHYSAIYYHRFDQSFQGNRPNPTQTRGYQGQGRGTNAGNTIQGQFQNTFPNNNLPQNSGGSCNTSSYRYTNIDSVATQSQASAVTSSSKVQDELYILLYLITLLINENTVFIFCKFLLCSLKFPFSIHHRRVKAPRKPPPTAIGSKKFKTQHVDTNCTLKTEGEMKLTAVVYFSVYLSVATCNTLVKCRYCSFLTLQYITELQVENEDQYQQNPSNTEEYICRTASVHQ